MKNQHFVVGTGPLFTFHTVTMLPRGMSVETSLLGSTLVNVSSSYGSLGKDKIGTGMMSPNLGGSLLCLNTSFSSCIREQNEDKEFSFENRTQTHIGRLNNVTSDVTSVSFTLCAFNEMTVSSSTWQGGGAISLIFASSSLAVNTCFFHKCTCPGYNPNGGAIIVEGTHQPFSVSDSSFTECSAGHWAGSIISSCTTSMTLHSCFFELSKAHSCGAVAPRYGVITMSNCAFVECTSTDFCGAVVIETVLTLSLSCLQFRQCSSSLYKNKGNDLHFYDNSSSEITPAMVQFCDSTSSGPTVFSIQVKQSVDVSSDGKETYVRVETEEAIKGTMGVLLDGSNVPRLVHVVFGDPSIESTVGTIIVSSGAKGVLPSATYTPLKSSLALFIPPSVRSADAALKDVNSAEIVLRGVSLEEGNYLMVVEKEETESTITLTHSDSTTLIGTASLSSSNSENRLEWGTEYKVRRVVWIDEDGGTAEEVRRLYPITFTTPAESTPPFSSLTDASAHIMKSDAQNAVIFLHFDREVSGSYDFVVEERGKDVSFTVVVTSPATTAETEEFVVVGDDRILTHDTTYTIKSIIPTPGSESTPVVMHDPISFHIPKSSYVPPQEPEDPEDPKKAMSPETKKLLSWLIPLIASLLVFFIVVIVILVLANRRRSKASTPKNEMEEQPDEKLDEKIVVEGFAAVNTNAAIHAEAISHSNQNVLFRNEGRDVLH
ncbi:hypothetical protein BLNAU_18820 [Blattamonas nauphoetae]|uniref:Uncharacterized protein n=1 Tax=Blattamonas nauphoetae TaxID=2049346 RepID=A0ABQ9X3R7_9EUKA|nr:hypothetical protein BLNAU_18820 [Blattamonas nauphoetae]